MNYFSIEESPVYKHKKVIRVNSDNLPFPNGIDGSFNLLPARLLNLSYADYLRYARDRLGAELVGKNKRYVNAYFEDTPELHALVRLLNKRMEYVMSEYNDPYTYFRKEDGTVDRVPIVYADNSERN